MKLQWQKKKLGDVCIVIPGQAPPSKYYNDEGKGVPFLTVNSFGRIYPKVERWTTKPLRVSSKEDVLFSVAGSLGLVNLGIDACITRSIFALRPKNDVILQKFLFYVLKQYGRVLASSGSGTAQRVLTVEQIRNFSVPLPTIELQRKIVGVLDTIQEAIEIQDKIIEKTKELKKAMMSLLFHYGIAGLRVKELLSSRTGELEKEEIEKLIGKKLKKTEIGEIPEDWKVMKLGEVCELRREQALPREDEIYVGLEHLDSGVLKLARFGKGDEVKSLKNRFYPKDILYGKLRPYLDKAVIAEKKGVCSTDLIVIKCNELVITPIYFVYMLHTSAFLNFAVSTMAGTNHPRTSWVMLKSFKIPLPPLSEQHKIAEILQTIDQKIEVEQKKKALYEELFKTMLNKIMKQEIDVEEIHL